MYTPYYASSSDAQRQSSTSSSETVSAAGAPYQPPPRPPPPPGEAGSFTDPSSSVEYETRTPGYTSMSSTAAAPPTTYSTSALVAAAAPPPPPYYGPRQSLQYRHGAGGLTSETGGALDGPSTTFSSSWTSSGYHASQQERAPLTTASYSTTSTSTTSKTENAAYYTQSRLTWVCLSLDIVLWLLSHESELLLPMLLMITLLLYAIDLANIPSVLLTTAGLSEMVLSLISFASADSTLDGLIMATLSAILWTTVAFHLALALCLLRVSSSSSSSTPRLNQQLQQHLSGLVPLLTSSLVTKSLTDHNVTILVATAPSVLIPLTFATLLLVLSYLYHHPPPSSSSSSTTTTNIPNIHFIVVILAPVSMYVVACANRLLSRYVGMDDVYELLIVSTVPLLLVLCLPQPNPKQQQTMSPVLSGMAPRHKMVLIPILSLIAFVSIQQRYLLSIAHSFAYHFMGYEPSALLSTVYGLLAVLSTLFSIALWNGQLSSISKWLGEDQEDAVQLGLAFAGLCVGKLFGLPWNFTPLPILAFLGLTLWMATRMFRYLAIFLFVFHATGMVIFTYRFAGIDYTIRVIGQIPLSLMRFGFAEVMASVLVGIVAGLAVRSSGGTGQQILKRLQLVGILMTLYSILLMALEITLLKRPIPTGELSGVELDADEDEDDAESNTLYPTAYAIGTALVLMILAVFMQRVKILTPLSALMIFSINGGKVVCLYMDAVSPPEENDESGWKLFRQSLTAALLVLVMFAPQVLLEPYHSKIRRRRSSLTATELPPETRRTSYVFAFVLLPVALIMAVPSVLFPLAAALSETYQNGLYATSAFSSLSLPILELVASTMALWGLSCLSMLNHYLPDSTVGQGFKKLAAFAFLIGTLLFLVSPILGSSISAKALSNNPYAAMSSFGSQLLTGKNRRTGGWGLLSAGLATLLALSGPLELRERRIVSSTGQSKKDRFLLLRTMIFSLLFGGGVAWFVVLQNLRDVEIGTLVFVGMSCLSVACMGTVAAVLGYFLELEAYDDAEQVVRFCLVLTAILFPVSWISTYFTPNSHWFGSDGWLSTYLVVVAITYLAIAVSLRSRPTKNAKTSGVANTMGLGAWAASLMVVYGRYGISGLDANYDIRLILGVPASVIATLFLSPMLLVLEGEATALRRSAVQRLSTGKGFTGASSSIGIQLSQLRRSNRWFPLFFGSVAVFLVASLYAILLRGSFLLRFVGGPAVAKSHEDVYASVYGSAATTASGAEHDLATLARLAISHSNALTASAKLAGCGFWTAPSLFGPLLHMAGMLSILPSLFLLTQQYWKRKSVPLSSVVVALPLHAIPLLLCSGLSCLRMAAVLNIGASLCHAYHVQQVDRHSKMRI